MEQGILEPIGRLGRHWCFPSSSLRRTLGCRGLGGYWSWNPEETWALIVWLNYAAWLHMRLTKGWRGRPMAMWAIVGVNMFLSGLHSYDEL